ncbi:MAG: carboxypeptidase M32 [Oscillospiraceae bacterium]|nr:carboxypeptidase M32 [Oscillospiraceae bacterium]
MNKENALEKLKAYENTLFALNHAQGLIYYDGATTAPETSALIRGNTLGELSRISYELSTAPENIEMLEYLLSIKSELHPINAREAEELYRDYDIIRKIPIKEYVDYQKLISDADAVWHKAKENNDFASFEPYLQKIFDSNIRFSAYIDSTKKPYDIALDLYERGLTSEVCDAFFTNLRKKLVPLVHAVSEADQIDDSPLLQDFPVDKQRGFSSYLIDILGIDRRSCIISETEHPFTIQFSKKDVRITTHYYENQLSSSLYSVVHEGGHALYELGIGDELMNTCLEKGVSMAIHESQSRFYENIIGRSREFCELILQYLKRCFPKQLKDIDTDRFYKMINKSEPSLIRTEADELTYCMHIMIRYELEKAMFDGDIKAHDLPSEWNRLYKEYLGVVVPDDRHGVLQDSHWSNGNIGYFPSYAFGSAYGAQILDTMNKEINVYSEVKNKNIKAINEWNREHIWKYGSMYNPTELFKKVCGKFNPDFYIRYLQKKYSEIYGISI